jgi:hypothetical protein
MVFHYFPHNYRALNLDQANGVVAQIIDTMNEAISVTHVRPKSRDVD